jgi:hypothetical protein
MKRQAKKISYALIKPILTIGLFRKMISKLFIATKYFEETEICNSITKDKTILSGPFKGMRYHSFKSAGSVIIPKIIGSYEDELMSSLEKLFAKDYSEIIDVGCAEGYYAIGLALKFPNAKVYAYDLDEQARVLCNENAIENNVTPRLEVASFLDAIMLKQFTFTKKGLLICDCEGFEKQLFTEASVKNLNNCNLIIELHDCNDDTISKTILPLFINTHKLSLIKSNPDKKLSNYPFIKKNGKLTDELLNERNGIIMYWAVLEPL